MKISKLKKTKTNSLVEVEVKEEKVYNYWCKNCLINVTSALDLPLKCPVCSAQMLSNKESLFDLFNQFYDGLSKKEKGYVSFSNRSTDKTIYDICISIPGQEDGGVLYPTVVGFKKYINLIEKMCSFLKGVGFKIEITQFFYTCPDTDFVPYFSFIYKFLLNENSKRELFISSSTARGKIRLNKIIADEMNKGSICKEYISKVIKECKDKALFYRDCAKADLKRCNQGLKILNTLDSDEEVK